MILRSRRRLASALSVIILFALASAAFALAPDDWGARAAAQAPGTFDLRDFGAVGDGTTDDAPALQAALDALAAAGGGTLNVPAGQYVIASPVHKDFTGLAGSITIEGVPSNINVDTTAGPPQLSSSLGLVSEFFPRTEEAHVAISLKGLRSLLVKDIAFVGTPDVTTDAISTLAVQDVDEAVVHHCEFYGLSTLVGGGIIHARRSGLHIEQTKFLGSVGNSGIYVPVVDNLEWKAVSLTDVVFLDFGLRPELFGKTGYAAPYSWVNVGNAAPVTPDSPRREVSIRRAFLDEGGYVGLSSLPFRYQPASAPIDLYYVTGLRMNVSNLGTSGHYFDGLNALLVENSRYGWTHNSDSAVYVLRSGHAILDRLHTEASATRLRADSSVSSLTVIDSVYEDLASAAASTRVIETEEDADDPVWYVRQRFVSALGREPDPAAHYYWSRRLLACTEDNDACVTVERAALEDYLGEEPTPNFAVEGVVADEAGEPLAGVAVALSGSQAVSTVTDAEGRYRFSKLPTSGVYTVTAAKRHYTFAPRVFDTPDGDQDGRLTAVLNRHAIRGRLTEAGGAAIAGATLTLSDASGPVGTATTDSAGNYTLANVGAGGNYTVTPRRVGYRFGPTGLSFGDLDADRTANFTATPGSHSVAGRVTTVGGAGVPGLTVTLSGAQAATATTDANGNYTFNGVPTAGNYTVTPGGSGVVFAPASSPVTDLAANASANFTVRFRVNHARASNGATAAASSFIDPMRPASAAINGDRRGQNWGANPSAGSGWHDATNNTYPDTLEITFGGAKTVDEINLFSVQDNFNAPAEPTETQTFTRYGVTNFRVEYLDGTAWAVVPGGLVVSNNKVWAKLTFAPLTTTKIRVIVNNALGGYSRLTEFEAWGTADALPTPPVLPPVNYALAANGATALASSTLDPMRAPLAAINGDRRAIHWGSDPSTGSGWHDSSDNTYPDWLEVRFAGSRLIDAIKVYGVQDSVFAPQEPTEALGSTRFGLVDFELQYWTGAAWATLPGTSVTGNNKVQRAFTFAPVTTDRVRLFVTKALAGYSRLAELEAWGSEADAKPNVASAANGATASASSTLDPGRAASAAINGDRRAIHWGTDPSTGSGWHDSSNNTYPDWLQVNFAGARTISEVNVFTVQDNVFAPVEPTQEMTFTKYGVTAFQLEYWTGSAWAPVPGASVTGNNKVWRKLSFAPLTTDRVRVLITGALAGNSRLTEVEVY